MDKFNTHEQSIVNACSSMVWRLLSRNNNFGIGFELNHGEPGMTPDDVELVLMDGPSKTGSKIMVLKASSAKKGFAWVDDIVTQLELQTFELQNWKPVTTLSSSGEVKKEQP